MARTGIVFVGCGFAAELHRRSLALHPGLRLLGVYDHDAARLAAFASAWGDRAYGSLGEALDDPEAAIAVNFAGPEFHAEATLWGLAAGKHVYTETPLAATYAEAAALAAAARRAGRRLAAAPPGLLRDGLPSLRRALREGCIGRPRRIHAQFEIATARPGARGGWPYALLAAAFGPARRVSAVAPTPASDAPLRLVEFDGGLEARLTPAVDGPCSCRLRVDGEQGALELGEFCGEASPPSARAGSGARGGPDFARGVAEWAQAVAEGRPSPFDADFAVHLAEIAERLRRPERFADAALRSSFAPIAQTLRP